MEGEIEDLHIQMDDISKAKMSVSGASIRAFLPWACGCRNAGGVLQRSGLRGGHKAW